MSSRPRRSHLRLATGRRSVAVLAFVLAFLAPSGAQAASSITRFAVGPVGPGTHCDPNLTPDKMLTTAAARTDMCVAYYFDAGPPSTGDDIKATVADTPAGFLATADTAPACTLAQFNAESHDPSSCPAATQVGSGEAIIRAEVLGLVVPQTVQAKVFNLEHTPNEVGLIGIELAPELAGMALAHTKLLGRALLRPNPDVGLRTIIDNQPRTTDIGPLTGQNISVDGFFLRLWGSKDDHPTMTQSFGLMGSDCSTDQRGHIQAATYGGTVITAEDSYRLTDCDKVPFGVDTKVTTSERRPDVNTAATVQLTLADNMEPKVTGNIRRTVLTLPAGMELAAQVASGEAGLPLCSAEQFAWDATTPSTCPAGSKIADVSFVSPLQKNEFVGSAYVGTQPAPGELPQLFLEAGFGDRPDAPRVKLRGTMRIDEQGRIESTLADLPQVLFSTFRLTFRGGDHSPIVTPRQCGTTQGAVAVAPAATGVALVQALPLTIDEDCVDPATFTPSLTVTTNNAQAGARGVTTIDTARPDRQARFTRVVADLPPGVISDLNLATECTAEQAAAFACPESSRIGTVLSTSGVGPAPYAVPGNVYLRTRDEGAVAGVVISVPVKFGGVDLGQLNVQSRIELRPADLGLRFIADVPLRFKGLSLNLRSFKVSLDRPDFAINPTNCSPLSTVSSLASDFGTVAAVPTTFQVTGCERLSFDPQLAFKISGKTAQGDKPAIGVKVSLARGGSNIKSTSVTLPPGLGADLKQVPRACKVAEWDAGTCSPNAQVGSAVATLAITPEVIPGTVSMVMIPGQTLPGIGIQLQGRFAARILGSIAIDQGTGQLITRFPTLPDVPISVLDLTLEGGARGALIATKALCAAPSIVLKGSFVGQSGATAERSTTASCAGLQTGGTPTLRITGSARKGLTIKVTAPTGKKLSTLKLLMPAGVSVPKAKLGKKNLLKGTKSVTLRGKRTLQVTKKPGVSTITIKIPKGSLRLTSSLRKKKTLSVTARLAYATSGSATLKAKAKP